MGIVDGGTASHSFFLVAGASTSTVTAPASADTPLTFIVVERNSGTAAQYNVIASDEGSGGSCNLFLNDVVYPTAS